MIPEYALHQVWSGGGGSVVPGAGILWLPLSPSLHCLPVCVCRGRPLATSALPRPTPSGPSSEGLLVCICILVYIIAHVQYIAPYIHVVLDAYRTHEVVM